MAAQGFPVFQRIHLPTLLKQELETGRPAISVDSNPMEISRNVSKPEFQLEPRFAELTERHRQEVVEPWIDFLIESLQEGIPGFTDDELARCQSPSEEFADLCSELRDVHRIRKAAEEMGYPHASNIDFQWLKYRHFQALLLQALIVRRRYQNPKNVKSRPNLEHDVQDMEYLTLGLHAGRLATREMSRRVEKLPLKWQFEILEPLGLVITA